MCPKSLYPLDPSVLLKGRLKKMLLTRETVKKQENIYTVSLRILFSIGKKQKKQK